MQVKLISKSTDPIETMFIAAKTCYSERGPIEWHELEVDKQKQWELVNKVLESGHMSIAEHVNFTFAVEGISRACSHQLVRHRHCTFSQQSQRYVEIKESAEEILRCIVSFKEHAGRDDRAMALMEKDKLMNIAVKYFVDVNDNNLMLYCNYLVNYLSAIQEGMNAEDARMFLPNATKTNIVITTNLRNLIHICNLRLCVRAQKEIRELFKLIVQEVERQYPCFSNLLKAQCDTLGYCPEASKSCGRYKTLKQLTEKE